MATEEASGSSFGFFATAFFARLGILSQICPLARCTRSSRDGLRLDEMRYLGFGAPLWPIGDDVADRAVSQDEDPVRNLDHLAQFGRNPYNAIALVGERTYSRRDFSG